MASSKRVEQRSGDGVVADQRVGQERPECHRPVAGQRRLDGQLLVGLGMGHEPAHLGRQRRLRERMRAVAIDPGRDLDDRVGGQVGQRAVVADVDDLDVAGAVVERGDELGRRLAVERAAALLEEGRLLGRASGRGTARAARARSP